MFLSTKQSQGCQLLKFTEDGIECELWKLKQCSRENKGNCCSWRKLKKKKFFKKCSDQVGCLQNMELHWEKNIHYLLLIYTSLVSEIPSVPPINKNTKKWLSIGKCWRFKWRLLCSMCNDVLLCFAYKCQSVWELIKCYSYWWSFSPFAWHPNWGRHAAQRWWKKCLICVRKEQWIC